MIQTKAELVYNKRLKGRYMRCMLYAPWIARQAGPGQFVNIRVNNGDGPLLRRPFSIHKVTPLRGQARSPSHQVTKSPGHQVTRSSCIEILYEVLGEGTQALAQRKPGECLDIIGPLGNGFDYASWVIGQACLPSASPRGEPARQAPCVLVAGGMGVAPLIFLAEKLTERKAKSEKRKVLVLIGAKTTKQILCENEFKKLGCEVKIATDDGSVGFKGKVTDLLKSLLSTIDSRLSTLYACGPRPMLQEISRVSEKYNLPAQISLEEHMACGIGACLGCVVKTHDACLTGSPLGEAEGRQARRRTQDAFEYKRVCKEGPVFTASQIVWGKE